MRVKNNQIIDIAAILTMVTGVIHLLPAAYTHYAPPLPLETVFFVSLGLAQIYWGLKFMQKPTERKYQIGIALNGGVAIFWLLTRTLPAPFQSGPEHLDAISTLAFALELGAVIALLFWEEVVSKKHLFKNTLLALAGILLVGIALYQSTLALENVFPDRKVNHNHGHEEVPQAESEEHVDEIPHNDEDDHGH